VASVPSGHVYVRHLEHVDPEQRSFTTLPDPDPHEGDRPAGAVWWPPVMLDAEWVDQHHGEFDVFHVHFGFDALAPEDLEAVVAALRRHRKPLVYTAHDLRNPHHRNPEPHRRQIGILIREADAVITLTQGAAEQIAQEWHRAAIVLAHPHVVPLDEMPRLQMRSALRVCEPLTVGVHVKSRRANMDPLPVIEALVEIIGDMPGARLRVDGHRDLLKPGGARYDERLATSLRGWERRGALVLAVHDYFSDEELWDYLARLDASVLPYRFGTHSGWLEACRDVGTAVIAPTCGFYTDQGPVASYRWQNETPSAALDAVSLAAAVRAVDEGRHSIATSTTRRHHQRDLIASVHEDLYRSLLGRHR